MDDRLHSGVVESFCGSALAPAVPEGELPRPDWRSRKLPRIDRLKAYWEERRGNRLVPLRRDIDPNDLKDLLPYIIIGELQRDPFRVRYRLGGAAVNEALGYNIAGRFLDEMEVAGGQDTWTGVYKRAMETARPVFGSTVATLSNVAMFTCEFAVFPISQSGDQIDQCLEIENWEAEKATAHYNDDRLEWAVTVHP
ncbi:MAG: PAS domain-containing protein [Dongiaceae bacterium]